MQRKVTAAKIVTNDIAYIVICITASESRELWIYVEIVLDIGHK